jgi:hypothetical protein
VNDFRARRTSSPPKRSRYSISCAFGLDGTIYGIWTARRLDVRPSQVPGLPQNASRRVDAMSRIAKSTVSM